MSRFLLNQGAPTNEMAATMTIEALSPAAVLVRLRHAYPNGIVPGCDYPALLAVLREHLPIDDVARIATELVIHGVNPLTGQDVRGVLGAASLPRVHATDIDRVTQCLRSSGWSLGNTG